MAAGGDNSNLLQELDVLSHSLYHSQPPRRTASLVLPRSSDSVPTLPATNNSLHSNAPISDARPRSRRLSISPFRSRPQPSSTASAPPATSPLPPSVFPADMEKKGGIWSWKPLRALSHIRMDRLSILVSVEVVAIQFLPGSMNGLRLSVCVRKKETKEGAVQTMPARVLQGAADFEETLFIRCHVYFSGGGGGSTGKPLRFEPRPLLIFPIAVDASELNFGQSSVDLSSLVKESMERSLEGSRVRQWDIALKLSGKAKGGEMVIKLGFQIMDDSGAGLYRQASEISSESSSSFARRQSKSSFSISSPKATRQSASPSIENDSTVELKAIEEFNLDEDPAPAPAPAPAPFHPQTSQAEMEDIADELEPPEFEVVDKGIESGLRDGGDLVENLEIPSEQAAGKTSAHNVILTELDSIAKQIKALELAMMNDDAIEGEARSANLCNPNQQLDDEEKTVTREFLQMLEHEDDEEEADMDNSGKTNAAAKHGGRRHEGEAAGYLSDLGKGLGSVVQTRDGGYLASMNPFDTEIFPAREAPKLTMQISRPIIMETSPEISGFEVFQNFAGKGLEELGIKLLSLTSMDEIAGKTAEQIAFEGVASAIVGGRNRELAKSAAARSIAALKAMAAEMNAGRKERIATGIWNVREEALASVEETLSFSLQKMEAMAVDGLKLQAGVPEDEAPFDVSPVGGGRWVLEDAASIEDWLKKGKEEEEEGKTVLLMVLVQLRDPARRYEAVGAPMISMVQAAGVSGEEGEAGYRVRGLHIGGMRLSLMRKTRSAWDGERQRLTAMQWLVGNGMAKGGKKSRAGGAGGGKDVFWSFSARVMAGMWLKPTRNPDVKLLLHL
ncbi:hypothetical protein KSP39_PZI007542 [Platanthera zijinensis]|uniref:C2 NT-type domain-containing protein n=1 Tax=Platanthera zijinensis TaxID=2320716 RepID=A0AAP0G8A1_9ASPA